MQNTYTWTADLASLNSLNLHVNPSLTDFYANAALSLVDLTVSADTLGYQNYLADRAESVVAEASNLAQFKDVMAAAQTLEVIDCAITHDKYTSVQRTAVTVKVTTSEATSCFCLTQLNLLPWSVSPQQATA